MSREIKFRGKRIDNGEWVYGYLSDENVIHGFVRNEHSSHGIVHDEFECEVDPETVGQYTGIKDINGKEIYEGATVSHRKVGDQLLSQGKVSVHPSQGVVVGYWPIGFDIELLDTP